MRSAPGMKFVLAFLLFIACTLLGQAQSNEKYRIPDSTYQAVTHGSKGFQFTSRDSNYVMQIQWRGQFRVAYPTDEDPITLDDLEENRLHLKLNRARMKVGGHAFRSYFKYYLEYELFVAALLDFRLMYEQHEFFKVKVGQWKVQYNRERIISSGKQQTVERSLLTRPFTVDRQQGIDIFGRLGKGRFLDVSYWIGTYMGTGRGASSNDDEHLMWMTRWQWNLSGEALAFSGSDLEYHDKFTMIVAVAGVTNQSQYTRFSTAGGGQLEGFEEGEAGQYRVNQFLIETAGKLRGFAWQQEFHWKQVLDRVNDTETVLVGNLIQGGYILHNWIEAIPKGFELFARHAFYIPDLSDDDNLRTELTMGLNYFINGHLNKLSLEYSDLNFREESEVRQDGSRVRLQWDVSF